MHIEIPEFALVLLVGSSGAGKSTFADRHFRPTEVVSSDRCRAMICDDENNQAVTAEAFEILHLITAKRLKSGRLTVIDATNVQTHARSSLLALARQYYCPTVAIVFHLPLKLCLAHNAMRSGRLLPGRVVCEQQNQLLAALPELKKEKFFAIHTLRHLGQLDNLTMSRSCNPSNRRSEKGPFDLIGDVHGCFDELVSLLDQLGYRIESTQESYKIFHPEGRQIVFLGDLVDRGPKTPEVLRLAMDAVKSNVAFCVLGNHERKLRRALQGHKVKISHGLAESLEQLATETATFRTEVVEFLSRLNFHYVFDDGRLVAAHAGLPEVMHGRHADKVDRFCLYGQTSAATDKFGLPVRHRWASDYRGKALVVYGHTPVDEPTWLNNTLCIDTGCVFGGKLTALRYPERDWVSVKASARHYNPPDRADV